MAVLSTCRATTCFRPSRSRSWWFSRSWWCLLPWAFALTSFAAGAAQPTADWDVASPPGPKSRQAIDVREGTWMNVDVSPDGQRVVFDLLGDLYLMPIDGADGSEATGGRTPRRLTQGIAWDMQPRFSPDGQTIAFTSDRTGKGGKGGDNIWLLDIDSGDVTQVTTETYHLLNGPTWRPDGQYIVARKHFTSRRSLGSGEMWLYHRDALAGGATAGVQLTEKPNQQKDVNEPAFSPDGRYLYYSQDDTPGNTFEYNKDSHKGIYVIKRLDLVEQETETLISGPGGACRPVPSPDGRHLAFVRRVGAKTGLHLYDLQSGKITLVYDQLERDMQESWAIHGVYSQFAWTPDSEAIVIWSRGQIRRIDVPSGQAETIPFHVQDEREVRDVVRFPVPVGEQEFDVRMLRWVTTSPDGSAVAYQALGHIYVRSLPDGSPRRLTTQEDHFEFFPSFSRDGQFITYCTWDDQRLGAVRVASVDPQAGENWSVTDEPGHYSDPVFSPDGQTVAYAKHSGGYLTTPLWSRQTGLYRSSVRGGDAQRIVRNGSDPHFADANDRLYFTTTDPGQDADNRALHSVGLDGHDRRTHYTSKWATAFRVSPDRRHVAFIERFNVYLAPLVDAGGSIEVGPQGQGLPIRKLSQTAGDFVHFSGDGKRLHWSLGPEYYTVDIEAALNQPAKPEPTDENAHADAADSQSDSAADPQSDAADSQSDDADDSQGDGVAKSLAIGFQHPHDSGGGRLAIVDARILTMGDAGEIPRGTLVIDGNRITAVGPSDKVQVPENARVISAKGQVVMPGLIDVHAHGPAANQGITPEQNWINLSRLAFGVTTIHDPSNDTHSIFAASELAKAGKIVAPRTFSTGKILYGATGASRVEVNALEDALFHLKRMQAVGAFSVKSYNQPRRDQRQQIIAAARKLKMMVVPEGGSTFMHNLTMIVDGHTGIEHTLPVQTAYDDVMDLWRGTNVGYTPTLNVAYGGLSGEYYWYEMDDLWQHPRLTTFVPPHVLNPRSRRRQKAPLEDYNHIRVAEIAQQVVQQGGLVQAGGHGQLAGICTHWELWGFVQGGMTPQQALECGTIHGARYLGLDQDLGSLEPGKLADLIILDKGADPTKNIRHSERIRTVIANGHAYEARRMNRHGARQPRPLLYWREGGGGSSPAFTSTLSESVGCSCGRCGI